MSLDDVRIAEALERIAERLTGFTQFLDDYAKRNFYDNPKPTASTYIPANPGWIIEWDEGYGPAQDRIIAWRIEDDYDSVPVPITTAGSETSMGKHGRIRHLDDDDA